MRVRLSPIYRQIQVKLEGKVAGRRFDSTQRHNDLRIYRPGQAMLFRTRLEAGGTGVKFKVNGPSRLNSISIFMAPLPLGDFA
jgi:hypothetical protein